MPLSEALSTTLAVANLHMEAGSSPAWVESDSTGLTALLVEHWSLTKTQTSRLKGWGE